MNEKAIEKAFGDFEKKYGLPPVFRMSNGKILGAFIITFESSEADILEAAAMVSPDNTEAAAGDLRALKAFCSAPLVPSPAPETLQ